MNEREQAKELMDTVKVQQVIVCTKARRGDGKTTPIRCITEVFDFDGNKISEADPNSHTLEEIYNFALIHFPKGSTSDEIRQKVANYFIDHKLY